MEKIEFPSSPITLSLPPAAEISAAQQALSFATQIVVADQRAYELAGGELQTIKARYNKIEETRKAIKAPLLQHTRQLDAFFDQALEPLRQAEVVIKRTMGAFEQEQRRLADEARKKHEEEVRKARIEAERKAEEARRAAEAEARRKREEELAAKARADEAERKSREAREAGDREAQKKAEAERKAAEADEARAREAAAKATQKGEEKASAAMEKAAEVAATPAPSVELASAQGVSTRSTWSAKVTDVMALCKAVAEGKVPATAVEPNMKALNLAAKSLKGELSKFYPGVEAVETKGLAVKA